jgi:hypothetical protein
VILNAKFNSSKFPQAGITTQIQLVEQIERACSECADSQDDCPDCLNYLEGYVWQKSGLPITQTDLFAYYEDEDDFVDDLFYAGLANIYLDDDSNGVCLAFFSTMTGNNQKYQFGAISCTEQRELYCGTENSFFGVVKDQRTFFL